MIETQIIWLTCFILVINIDLCHSTIFGFIFENCDSNGNTSFKLYNWFLKFLKDIISFITFMLINNVFSNERRVFFRCSLNWNTSTNQAGKSLLTSGCSLNWNTSTNQAGKSLLTSRCSLNWNTSTNQAGKSLLTSGCSLNWNTSTNQAEKSLLTSPWITLYLFVYQPRI